MPLLSSSLSTARNVCWRCRLVLPLSLKRPPRRTLASTSSTNPSRDLTRTRNIGIIAHIDAGKTTTTERMLFYSGFTRRLGEVDEGSTVMDYLPAERARGITITSAAITFDWTPPGGQPHTINLIDTPGHADFTFEVERAIRVLDGAVTVLDGVAGVEAQTEAVWRQAAKYRIPRIVFINKLDRVGARFGATVREVAAKLNGWPAVLQLPLYEKRAESSSDGRGGEDVLRGVVDLVEKRVFLYEQGGDGRNIAVRDYAWLHEHRAALHAEALAAREALVELLSEHDEGLVELFLELGEPGLIPAAALKASLRKLTLPGSAHIVPVLCGASFRNVGVQPLLDAIVDYLPSPVDRPPADVTFGGGGGGGVAPLERGVLDIDAGRTCALAFKVVNDPKRGAMVFVRVYSGSLSRAQTLYNTSLRVKERAHRLLQMYADEAVDIDAIPTGHIGVILGLKQARTGDTLVSEHASPSYSPSPPSSPSSSSYSSSAPSSSTKAGEKAKKQRPVAKYDPKTLQLRPIDVPPPVFFASLEPYSLAEQKNVEEALAMLLREDPSLSVSTDPDSGQLLLSGMGELHLEIGRDRLVHDLKAKADMGRILIAYRETVSGPAGPEHRLVDREIAAKPARAACTASVRPSTASDYPPPTATVTATSIAPHKGIVSSEGNTIEPIVAETHVTDAGETVASKLPAHLTAADISAAIVSGAAAALARGPHLGFPLRHVHATVSLDPATDLFPAGSTPGAISSAARHAVAAALHAAQAASPGQIVEPVMAVTVSCDEKDLGKVVADISSNRGGHVLSLGDDDEAGAGAGAAGRAVAQSGEVEMKRVFVPAIGAEGRRSGGGREAGEGRKRAVHARVPLGEMVGYLKHLRAMTKGSGTFVMALDGWQRMQGPRAREVERGLRGE